MYLMGYDYNQTGLSIWVSLSTEDDATLVGYKMMFGKVSLFHFEEDPIERLGSTGVSANVNEKLTRARYARASNLLDRVNEDYVAAFGLDNRGFDDPPGIHVQLLAREFLLQIICSQLPDVSVDEYPREPLSYQFAEESRR
jgi:hypothetical protein